MNPAPTGPLFQPPGAAGFSWLALIPVLLAIPAIVILAWGLVRGRLPAALAAAGIVLPIAAYGFASGYVMEGSKEVSFCGSCHVMGPIVDSLSADDKMLASTHYRRGLVPHEHACYTCHSGYGIWGTMDAKMAGLMHMVRTITGKYDLPLELNGKFDIASCLNCHAAVPSFRAVEAHQDPELQKQLVSGEMSCTGLCHPEAHPASALTGQTASLDARVARR
ncbi:NapC/NirT family cytochrome c [bacterium]|nr:NapC/NirT family cytochrome c [bacterium]